MYAKGVGVNVWPVECATICPIPPLWCRYWGASSLDAINNSTQAFLQASR